MKKDCAYPTTHAKKKRKIEMKKEENKTVSLCFRPTNEEFLPAGRQGHAWAHYENSLFIFGGRIADRRLTNKKAQRTYINDLWRYNLDDEQWTEIEGKGDIPSPRHNHSAIFFDNKIWVFGGANEEGIFDDLYTFSIKENLWKRVTDTKGKIPQRHGHTATLYHSSDRNTSKMIIFGGGRWNNNEREYMCDVYCYDLLHNTWECLPAKGSIPCGRSFHSTILHQNSLIVFGGWWMTGDGKKRTEYYTNDLLQYNLQTDTWTQIPVTGNIPGPRNRQSCVKICEDETIQKVVLLVYGGNYYAHKTRKGEFYSTAYRMDLVGPELDLHAHWTLTSTRGEAPLSHHHAVFYDGKMYIGMGEARRVKFNTTYVVDFVYK